MKKWISMLLVLALCLSLAACGSTPEPEETAQTTPVREETALEEQNGIVQGETEEPVETQEDQAEQEEDTEEVIEEPIEEAQPTGQTIDVECYTEGDAQVHSAVCELLTNGCVRFTLEVTPPEGRQVFIFDPPDGDNFSLRIREKTTAEKLTLSFDVEPETLVEAGGITVNFYNDAVSDWLFLMPDLSEFRENPTGADLFANYTDGQPTGQELRKLTVSADLKVQIHGLIAEVLDNGYVRFTVGFIAPADRHISVFYPPNDILFYTEDTTEGGMQSFVFDIPMDKLKTKDSFTMKFYDWNGNGDFVTIRGPFKP